MCTHTVGYGWIRKAIKRLFPYKYGPIKIRFNVKEPHKVREKTYMF